MLGCVIQITDVFSDQPVMKQRSPVVNQRLGDHVSLRRNSIISPSLLNTLRHQQMSSRPLLCSWFDRERSSAQEEKWRCDSLQLETSIWKHTHTYINMLLSSFVDFGIHAILWFPYCVIYIMSWFIFCGHYKCLFWGQATSRYVQSTSRRLQDLNVFWKHSP